MSIKNNNSIVEMRSSSAQQKLFRIPTIHLIQIILKWISSVLKQPIIYYHFYTVYILYIMRGKTDCNYIVIYYNINKSNDNHPKQYTVTYLIKFYRSFHYIIFIIILCFLMQSFFIVFYLNFFSSANIGREH